MNPIQYLAIDIANNFGLDKENFEDRIKFVKDNLNNLEDFTAQAEEPFLFAQGVKALRKTLDKKPTGYMVSFDATCSGIQVMSCLTGCLEGALITNLIDPNKRYDAYTVITDAANAAAVAKGAKEINISRADAKQAVMTSAYGSKAIPFKLFGEGVLLDSFYEAAYQKAPGAFGLMDTLLGAWQPFALEHSWVMPDMFNVVIKVTDTLEKRIEIDELDHHQFTVRLKENVGLKKGVSLVANVTHSVDGYVLRNLVRRASLSKKKVKSVLSLIKSNNEYSNITKDSLLYDMFQMWEKTGITDPLWFELINEKNFKEIPSKLVAALEKLGEQILSQPSFHIVCIHDAFKVHPNHAEALCYHYKEILAEIAESNLLKTILERLTGKRYRINKLNNNLGQLIRGSRYALC